jgi:hypothetical protein
MTTEFEKYTYNELNPDVKFNAIITYCKVMNCFGLENQVDIQLSKVKNIFFNEEGYLIKHIICNN